MADPQNRFPADFRHPPNPTQKKKDEAAPKQKIQKVQRLSR